jgi:hypothetical protein
MSKLGTAIIEALVYHYGKQEVLRRLSDPFWFQSLGAVMGMDWHSSGITTSVLGSLKAGVNPISKELGIYICGGRGKHSRKTPDEITSISDKIGLDGDGLVRASKLSAKVDNNAVQDGFQLYLHSFIMTDEGDWAVVQQGMNQESRMARRYHWSSQELNSFISEPHKAIVGINKGIITNLVDSRASKAQKSMLEITHERPIHIINEMVDLKMPSHHEVRAKDVDLKRLGAVLAIAHDRKLVDFANLLMIEGLGPRTIQSLALVSEVIHGTESRFKDPARFSFAHGGKDGYPFPVPVSTYDESIGVLQRAVELAKIDRSDKIEGLKKLGQLSRRIEKDFEPVADFDMVTRYENENSYKHGGRTVFGKATPCKHKEKDPRQLTLF